VAWSQSQARRWNERVDTEKNQKAFPQSRGQKPALGFPLARLVGIVSLSCGAVLEWASGPCAGKKTGETALLWGLMDKISQGDVLIADRYFSGYFGIARLQQRGVDVVIRQHQRRHTDFRRGRRLGKRDHVVTWARPQRPSWMDQATYAALPESIVMREVRVAGLTLVTTLLNAVEVSKLELVDLYGKRWQIELDFRSIKTVMQMEILRCKSPEMIQKEIAVHLLAYNLVRTVMAQAACLAHLLPRQLSFKATLQVLNAFEENLRFCPRARLTTRHVIVLASIGQVILPIRPDRVEPRAVKRRPKPQKLLSEPRYVLRERLLKQKEQLVKYALR
jgi:Transposase DDE domain